MRFFSEVRIERLTPGDESYGRPLPLTWYVPSVSSDGMLQNNV